MIINIRTLKNHLENRKINGNDAIAIMAVIRKQMERDEEIRDGKVEFKWLYHFCNWCLHPNIEFSNVSLDIINSFIRAFLQVKKIEVFWYNSNWALKFEDNRESIENYFDLIINNFRTDLTKFLNIYHINTDFIKTDENFIFFFARVFYIVKNSPLHVPNKINRQRTKEYDELKTLFYKQWIWSKGVPISKELYPTGIQVFHNLDGSFGLSVEMKNGQSISFSPITYHGGTFRMQPEAVNEFFYRGNALVDKGELEKAATAFQKSINIWPTSTACGNLSSVFSKLGKHSEALSTAEKAVELNPDDHIAWINKSQTLINLKRYEEALIAAKKAISLKCDFPQAWCNKSAALNGLGQHEESLSATETAIKLNPDYIKAWSNKINTLIKLGRHEEAKIAIGKANELQRKHK